MGGGGEGVQECKTSGFGLLRRAWGLRRAGRGPLITGIGESGSGYQIR